MKLDMTCRGCGQQAVEMFLDLGDQPLTQKEFSLLEYFLRNANRPLTRTEIGENVWDVHFDNESNVIDVYVRHLRKKIDEPFPTTRLLHTVTGYGYVLKRAEPPQ